MRDATIDWSPAGTLVLRAKCELRSKADPETVQGLVQVEVAWTRRADAPDALAVIKTHRRGALDQFLMYAAAAKSPPLGDRRSPSGSRERRTPAEAR